MKYRIALLTLSLVFLLSLPAAAGTKEQLIQLQTQVQALQDQMARMQQSFDERMGVMRNLVEQSTDSVNRLNNSLANFDKGVKTQITDSGGKVDQLSTQVQSLQDSVDEMKTRLAKVSKQLEDMQAAQQNMAAPALGAPGTGMPQSQAPPADVLYNNALRDYNAAKYDLASQQFGDYMKFYSTTELAGNAQFYIADILYRQGDFARAVPEYDKVLEQFPGGNKAAAAQLKKGYALLEIGQRDAGMRELRSLVGRYPRTIEATQARERLKKLGAAPTAAKPSPTRRSSN
jgi:tol-pal system protein YbgF